MRQPIILGSGTHYKFINTLGASGAPITLTSGALRARVNGGPYVDAGLTLSTDHTDGSGAVTGQHRIALDIDDATLALEDGDEVDVFASDGDVDGVDKAGTLIWSVVAVEDGLTQAQRDHVQSKAQDALQANDITGVVVDDAGNSSSTFEIDQDVGADVRLGSLRFTAGTLAGESRVVAITGTQATVLAPDDVPAGLENLAAFSAEPTAGDAFRFRPIS